MDFTRAISSHNYGCKHLSFKTKQNNIIDNNSNTNNETVRQNKNGNKNEKESAFGLPHRHHSHQVDDDLRKEKLLMMRGEGDGWL